MAVAEVHPCVEELAAFTLGTLEEETDASIEAHIASCTSCQEQAANAPDDSFVELLRSVHARMSFGTNTAAQSQTPPLPLPAEQSAVRAPAVAVSALAEADRISVLNALPAELARHERYRVVRLLGAGGMGAVYLAEHRVMQRLVALKVMKRAYTASPAALERFRHEVRAAARLSHPNIVITHDAEDAGETNFLVMEFVEGTDLGRLVQERGPLPVDRACDYVRQAALGLQYAFEQGMVHRDLKPHNLMLTPDGRVKILDFGLSRFASEAADAAGLTSTGIVLGTVDYIAPEQADNARQADIRSDIYSLGCTLYHLLAGQPPFPAGTALQKVLAHVEKKPQPLTELCPDLPEELMLVLDRMMAKNPIHRYQTPGEVGLALQSFLGAPPAARQLMPRLAERTTDIDGTGRLTKEPARNRRRPRFAIAAAFLAFVIIGSLGVCVYRIATDNGELIIETENDDVEIVVSKGGRVVKIIDTTTGKQVTLDSGDYELELKDGGGLKISPDRMTLKRGKTVLAKITRLPPNGPPSGLVAWWSAEENAKDSVGNNHGTLKGGVKFAPGVAGQAFDFNGIDGRINLGNAPRLHLSSGDFSVSAWVNFRSLKHPDGNTDKEWGDMYILDKMSAAGVNHDGWALLKQDDNHFWFGFGGGNTNGLIPDAPTMIQSTTSVVPGVWYHVVAVKRATQFSLYVNGIEEASKPLPAFKDTNTADLEIGAAPVGYSCYMNGLIDEATIYSRGLSPAEVKTKWGELAPKRVGEIRRFEGHTGDAHCVAYSPNGRYAVSGGGWPTGDATIRVWEVATGKQIHKFDSFQNVLCVAFSPHGRHILYGGDGNTAVLLYQATGKEVWRSGGFGDAVLNLAFSPDGRKIIVASQDCTARVLDADTGKELCKFDGHVTAPFIRADGSHARVMEAVFTPDGKRAVTGADDGTIYLWDVKMGEKLRSFEGSKYVHTVAVSPDGRYVAAGCWQEKQPLKLWDMATGKLVREFIGQGHVSRVRFSHDGCRAISSSDNTVRLWDVATGKELYCFTGHTDRVWGVAFSPDDRYALSASQDKTLRLWRLPNLPAAKENP
jgi:WD40 repeat protein/predicted Ser/Thr protein kinase